MSLPDPEMPERFHRVLVEEIRARRPEYLGESFTVAEIYQDLIPYRTHRDRLGVEMNADYEDALLRLLAGEGDLLHLESDAARRDLRSEIRSPNPDTGIFRNFAAATVRLAKEIPASEPGPGPDDAEEGAFAGATPAEDPPAVGSAPEADERNPPSAEADEGVTDERIPASAAADEATCPWCRERLPGRPDLDFCPFCGTSLDVIPCTECGEELEPHWRFCVRCGTEVPA